ncbi:MAG TPA: PQQ-dependent sugar dehydrogenase, partial [Chitinophagaceae bacterium]|nr:PQQ-dependent sugar dehydrogenase [Chitinophagaceae bacterium]
RQIILDHRASTFLNISRDGSGAATSIGQDGMMGMALHPNFRQGTDSIYIAYTRTSGNVRISRFKYNAGTNPTLTGETVLVQGIPANGDHSSGRLIIGGDNKLYYTCGDLGANQFGNRCTEIKSQTLPTASQISANNFTNYAGKILRINMDGSIPADNPVWNGVRSHIYTIGHRNPQGLVWQKYPSAGTTHPALVPNGKLFSDEHGPRTDDEINIIQGGRNYGWPYIAGRRDGVNYEYVNWSSSASCSSTPYTESTVPAGATVRQESNYDTLSNFQPPLTTMYASCGSLSTTTCNAGGTDWMRFATIAPSSIEFYHIDAGLGIPGWYPSLLVPTLRRGTLYRYKLRMSLDSVITDSIPYFKTSNRYRDIAMSPDGKKIYLITDSIGSTSGPSGSGTSALADRGAILEYTYTGPDMLDYRPDTVLYTQKKYRVSIYPNPATQFVTVDFEKGPHKPIRYRLVDAWGKLVMENVSSKDHFTITVGHLRKGVYMLKLYNGYGIEVKVEKIVVL